MSFRASDRVTCDIDTSYAVGSKPGVCLDERPASPAAAWYVFVFSPKKLLTKQLYLGKRRFNFDLFGEKVALRATFSPKRMSGTTLPKAE